MSIEKLLTGHGMVRSLDRPSAQPPFLTRISHQLPAATCDAPHPAVFSRLGVLDVPQVRAPRPLGRKPHWARHLAGLATKPGEICGLSLRHSPQVSTLSHHHFVEMSTELLRQGYSVRFQAPGNSMMPTVSDGERITVRPVSPSDIKPGDIILYRYPGSIVAHRVVRIEKRNGGAPRFILRGDALGAPDEPVEVDQVLGKVKSVERGGRSIDLYSRKVKIIRMLRLCASHIKRWARNFFDKRLPRAARLAMTE